MDATEPVPRAPDDALLVVDVQNDFLPGGALAVAQGDEVIAPLNAWLAAFATRGCAVFASRDWHPAEHCSFRGRGGPWPVHCVAGSPGAAFAASLALPPHAVVVSKGTARDAEAYSAFSGTALAPALRAAHARRLWVGGLATDYCVLETVRDARRLGFEVVVLQAAVRGVEANEGDVARACEAMRAAGARFSSAVAPP
jgi:nicotinamidase/pyrazinamidase